MLLISEILLHSVSQYAFMILILILYFLYLKKSGRRQSRLHLIGVFLFCYYLIGILTMTGIGKLESFSPRLSLIPFADMINGPVDTILNVILFFPLGIFLPLLYKKYIRISQVAFTGFFISLSVEMVQMFGCGATDINDLITNTLGTCLGYLIYKVFSVRIGQTVSQKFYADKIRDGMEVLFLVICSFVSMVILQPLMIHMLFHLG